MGLLVTHPKIRDNISPECWYNSTRLHGIIVPKKIIVLYCYLECDAIFFGKKILMIRKVMLTPFSGYPGLKSCREDGTVRNTLLFECKEEFVKCLLC